MLNSDTPNAIDTVYGRFTRNSKRRLDLTFDYESAEIASFRKIADLLQPALLLDIGANIGVYAVFLSPVASLKSIHAFEPAPDTFRILKRNVALQGSARFTCHNKALSDRSGSARFSIYGATAGNNAISETAATATAEPAETIEVPTARLDDLIEAKSETFMCKIDVEGHEISVIDGAGGFLSRNTGVLQIEAFKRLDELDAKLRALGYQRIFRMKHDYYYTNISDAAQKEAIVDLMFAEVAGALSDLKDERRRRRLALRTSREAVNALKFDRDPVLQAK
jgi:FkbM family methyltransferase